MWSETDLLEDEYETVSQAKITFLNGTPTVSWKQKVGSEYKIYDNEFK